MHPFKFVFDVEFTCDKCGEVQHLKSTIADMLSDLHESGWPICPECGDDMDESIAVPYDGKAGDYCKKCSVPEHDTCSMTDGCPCCETTKRWEKWKS